jgi:hypothetical protein
MNILKTAALVATLVAGIVVGQLALKNLRKPKQDISVALLQSEQSTRAFQKAIAQPAYEGCLTTVLSKVKQTGDLVLFLQAGDLCSAVTGDIVTEYDEGRSLCKPTDERCAFLAGCIKENVGTGNSPTDSKAAKTLTDSCSSLYNDFKTAREKQDARKDD